MFGKQIFAGPSLTMGHREDFDQKALLGSSLSHTSWYQTLVIYDGISPPGAGPLLGAFRQLGERAKFFLSLVSWK